MLTDGNMSVLIVPSTATYAKKINRKQATRLEFSKTLSWPCFLQKKQQPRDQKNLFWDC